MLRAPSAFYTLKIKRCLCKDRKRGKQFCPCREPANFCHHWPCVFSAAILLLCGLAGCGASWCLPPVMEAAPACLPAACPHHVLMSPPGCRPAPGDCQVGIQSAGRPGLVVLGGQLQRASVGTAETPEQQPCHAFWPSFSS